MPAMPQGIVVPLCHADSQKAYWNETLTCHSHNKLLSQSSKIWEKIWEKLFTIWISSKGMSEKSRTFQFSIYSLMVRHCGF